MGPSGASVALSNFNGNSSNGSIELDVPLVIELKYYDKDASNIPSEE